MVGCDAYVLHTRPWRDSSLLVDLLVRERGRLRAVARGMRSRRRGGNPCQLFQRLTVELAGRSDLKQLRRAELVCSPHHLQGTALFAGLYSNELLLRSLVETEPSLPVFDAYARLLDTLARPRIDLEPALRQFERLLLAELGFAIDFDHSADGSPLQLAGSYQFVRGAGFVSCASSSALDYSSASGSVPVFSGALLLRVGRGELGDAATRRCAKLLMRSALPDIIGDQPLRSRELFSSPRPDG